MIYLEAPVGVGYSEASDAEMQIINDDTTSSLGSTRLFWTNLTTSINPSKSDNRDAIKDFFTKFPSYLENGIFISGESYAGIYVPTLISKIVDDAMLSPHFKEQFLKPLIASFWALNFKKSFKWSD